MLKWMPYVMVRIAAFFIAGILLGIYQPELFTEFAAFIGLGGLLLFYFISYQFLKKNTSLKLVTGFTGLIAILVAGYLNVLLQTESRNTQHILKLKQPIFYYTGRISNVPEEKIKSWKILLEIEEVQTETGWSHREGKTLLYVSKKSTWPDLLFGDKIMIKGSPVLLSPSANPGEFDFKRFLTFKNIYHQQFVKSDQIRVIDHTESHGVLYYSNKTRAWASNAIKQFVHGEHEQAIALALVLGVTDGLDNELQNAYSASGAMHVLAVSGLQVGIIYWMLLIVLKPVSSLSWSRWLVAIISLVCLWSYAFITGLSPSVLRAVAMFSFIAIARPFGRGTNIYNTLAASAFLLLLYNPYLIMSVGFQLSYLAVLGIVYLQRPIYNLWETSSWFWDKVWQITCVSIAAQIATFSLGLLYFHQFPLYFLFSNLFVIPGSFIVLVLGIVLLSVSFILPFAIALGWLLQHCISLLNWAVFAVEDLPLSLINGIHLTTLQCWLLMAWIVSIALIFQLREFRFALLSLFFILTFSILQWQHVTNEVARKQFLVYATPGHFAMEWTDNGKSYFVADSTFAEDEERIRFHVRPNRIISGVTDSHVSSDGSVQNFRGFELYVKNGVRVLRIDNRDHDLPKGIVVDYLIVGNNSIRSIAEISAKIEFKKLILDGTNSPWYVDRIEKETQSKNDSVYAVGKKSAFIVTL
jgi:competence protein ComEC